MVNQQLYKFSAKLVKFGLVGILNTALNFLIFYVVAELLGVQYLISQTISFLIVNVLTFTLNKNWTFQNKSRDYLQQFLLYLVGRSFALLLGLMFTYVLVEMFGVNPLICQIYVTGVYILFNFFWSYLFVFKAPPRTLESYLSNSYKAREDLKNNYSGTVYYLVPVFEELNRLKKFDSSASGEDFVSVKIRQLDSFYKDLPDINYELIFIDDGDMVEKTGLAIQKVIEEQFTHHSQTGRARVLYLEELMPEWVKYSQKGGALLAVVKYLLPSLEDSSIVFYTDADVSSNLEQSGLLVSQLLHGADVSVSSRWHEESTVIGRTGIGMISSWIYAFCVWLIIRLDISDTQNGFKAYRGYVLKSIHANLSDLRFSFDTEWLLASKKAGFQIQETELFWVDSTIESKVNTFRDSLKMLNGLLSQRRKFKSLK